MVHSNVGGNTIGPALVGDRQPWGANSGADAEAEEDEEEEEEEEEEEVAPGKPRGRFVDTSKVVSA